MFGTTGNAISVPLSHHSEVQFRASCFCRGKMESGVQAETRFVTRQRAVPPILFLELFILWCDVSGSWGTIGPSRLKVGFDEVAGNDNGAGYVNPHPKQSFDKTLCIQAERPSSRHRRA